MVHSTIGWNDIYGLVAWKNNNLMDTNILNDKWIVMDVV